MNDLETKKRLINITFIFVALCFVILALNGFIVKSLKSVQTNLISSQMESETGQYISIIKTKIDADFQILETISGFLKFTDVDNDPDFAKSLNEANNNNEFIRMAYFDKSGKGTRVAIGYMPDENVPVTALSERVRDAVYQIIDGEQNVSDIYFDSYLNKLGYFYGIPIYNGAEIQGALLATSTMDYLKDMVNNASILSGKGTMHIIDKDGNFIVRSNKTIIYQNLYSIFDNSYISSNDKARLLEMMKNGESGFYHLNYKDSEYVFYLAPTAIDNAYVCVINMNKDFDNVLYSAIFITRITIIALSVITILFIFFMYHSLYTSANKFIKAFYTDLITGGDNFHRFKQNLEASIKRSRDFAVVSIDLHNFKFINEIFGTKRGDELLCYIKSIIENEIAEEEYFCRESADRFFIYFNEKDEAVIRDRIEKIINKISMQPFYSYNNYQLMFYCGVVICANEHTADEIIIHNRFALRQAQKDFLNYICIFDNKMHEKEELENYVLTHMFEALANKEFKLFLQPKMDLKTNTLAGAEALVRWKPQDRAMLFPDSFIPLFESNGFCIELDMYMLEASCKQIRYWIDSGVEPIPISINQSKLLFYEKDYIDKVEAILNKYEIPRQFITLEILEGLAINNLEEINNKIDILHNMGIRISLDDFGSGYSSLNILGKLKIDELKIDRDFLLETQVENNSKQRLVMEQIIVLAKKLNISTLAEGVETACDERFLQSMECDLGQGYYYSKPISAVDFNRKFIFKNEE